MTYVGAPDQTSSATRDGTSIVALVRPEHPRSFGELVRDDFVRARLRTVLAPHDLRSMSARQVEEHCATGNLAGVVVDGRLPSLSGRVGRVDPGEAAWLDWLSASLAAARDGVPLVVHDVELAAGVPSWARSAVASAFAAARHISTSSPITLDRILETFPSNRVKGIPHPLLEEGDVVGDGPDGDPSVPTVLADLGIVPHRYAIVGGRRTLADQELLAGLVRHMDAEPVRLVELVVTGGEGVLVVVDGRTAGEVDFRHTAAATRHIVGNAVAVVGGDPALDALARSVGVPTHRRTALPSVPSVGDDVRGKVDVLGAERGGIEQDPGLASLRAELATHWAELRTLIDDPPIEFPASREGRFHPIDFVVALRAEASAAREGRIEAIALRAEIASYRDRLAAVTGRLRGANSELRVVRRRARRTDETQAAKLRAHREQLAETTKALQDARAEAEAAAARVADLDEQIRNLERTVAAADARYESLRRRRSVRAAVKLSDLAARRRNPEDPTGRSD